MVIWAEKAYETELKDLPDFIQNLIDSYDHSDMSKVNIVNVAITCLLKNLFFNETLDMSEDSVLYAKYQIIRMLFPQEYGVGPFSIMKWNELLNPTAEPYFRSIPQQLWEELQQEAKLLLEQEAIETGKYQEKYVDHWKSIIEGEIPFGFRLVEAQPIDQNDQ